MCTSGPRAHPWARRSLKPGSERQAEKRQASRTRICRGRTLSQERRQSRPGPMGGTAQPSSRLNREPAAKQMCRDDAAVPPVMAMLPYLLSNFLVLGCKLGPVSSVTVLFLAVGARSPTCAREKGAGSDHIGGWGPGIDHLQRDRRLFPLFLSLCRSAGWMRMSPMEPMLGGSSHCLRTAPEEERSTRAGVRRRSAAVPAPTHL